MYDTPRENGVPKHTPKVTDTKVYELVEGHIIHFQLAANKLDGSCSMRIVSYVQDATSKISKWL